jgi:hypothetical protein
LRPLVTFHGHLVYFWVVWYIFLPFWYVLPRKSGNPGLEAQVGIVERSWTGVKNSSAEKKSRVARWYILKPKIPVWVNFGVSCNERCW